MNMRRVCTAVLLLLGFSPDTVLSADAAGTVGTFVPAPGRVDMVHDGERDLIYISQGSEILRYSLSDDSFLPPVWVGGVAKGLDLSPSGDTLAVADFDLSADVPRVRLVDLDTLEVRVLEATMPGESDFGTWAVSYTYDGSLLATTSAGFGFFRSIVRFDPEGGEGAVLANVMFNSMLSASGDRKVVAYAESGISDGPWGRYDAVSGDVVRRYGYEHGTSRFNYEIGTNARGTQFAIPTYGGAFVYDATYTKIATLGAYAAGQPVGVAYHPVDSLAYFPWAESSEVRVYDMELLAHVGSYDLGYTFEHPSNTAFRPGRVRLSDDGSLLMVSVGGGVRVVRLYAPLQAAPLTMHVPTLMKRKIALQGSVGNGGAVRYEIVTRPIHGTVILSRGYATYAPYGRYTGSDSFTYRVRYGRASADAVVTIKRF